MGPCCQVLFLAGWPRAHWCSGICPVFVEARPGRLCPFVNIELRITSELKHPPKLGQAGI